MKHRIDKHMGARAVPEDAAQAEIQIIAEEP